MAGCDTHPELPGDDDAWKKAIRNWVLGGLALGGLLAYLNIANAVGLATLGGGAATIALLAVLVGALAAGVIAGFIGYAVEWFKRLKVQNPASITISALVVCAGKNSGIPPFADGDWTFNVSEAWAVTNPIDPALTIDEVRTRAAPAPSLPYH